MNMLVSLMVPCYNEEEALPYLYDALCKVMEECSKYEYELIFVNDGSRDRTLSVLKDMAENYDALLAAENAPMFNRCTWGQYLPGSTFKIIPAVTALHYSLITPKSTYLCSGCLSFGRDTKCCWNSMTTM